MKELRIDKSPPICITGMHRSGTSTIAQLLHRCGVYLGPEKELFAAGPANPDGYWENRKFVAVNNSIFEAYNSGWDLPPSLEPGWQTSERLAPARAAAKNLVRRFKGHEPWGWKDPRTSVTMPFWRDLLPEMRVVVCLRNPLEVALSLRKRGNSSVAFGLKLWEVYNRRLLDALPEDRYIVTHYEAYFYRPLEELRRVLDFLELPASDMLLAHARSSSLKSLRNHRVTIQDLRNSKVSWPHLLELYAQLCRQAEWDPEIPSGKSVVGETATNTSSA